ncbi:hypothetical protein, partial [Xanthomonas oryzae]|uniref:hypothetical protein n=1 Tax=Xanthomonas oryzae TaxID=347 RepID=UPI002852C237
CPAICKACMIVPTMLPQRSRLEERPQVRKLPPAVATPLHDAGPVTGVVISHSALAPTEPA